ncbi:MAG TPA: hypothetical protein VJ755_08920 [Gemmatimonadales bacterium]|nr:hypothetical protein [Gemmatimonadales bacterium]
MASRPAPEQSSFIAAVARYANLDLQPLPDQLEAFVRETFVLPARHAPTGLRVDFIFSTTPYERQAIGRAVHVDLGGEPVPFASAEDLIIHKLFAARPRSRMSPECSVARIGSTGATSTTGSPSLPKSLAERE